MNGAIDLVKAEKSLDNFLVENQELESLNARLSAFNMFQVLRVDFLPSQALTHWNFLPRPAPMSYWFHYAKRQGKLSLVLEVGPDGRLSKTAKLY